MKLKSILIFGIMVILILMVVPTSIFCFQLLDNKFDQTWIGEMINKM